MPIDPVTLVTIAAVALAGFVAGFAGFGGALIFMPVASALIDPRTAAAAFLIVSIALMGPMVWHAVRICHWPSVLPAAFTAAVTVPVGAAVLATTDPVTIRWFLSAIVLVLLALLASGRTYTRQPHPAVSAGVGAVAGFLGGIGQVSGPPVVAFWMSGPHPPAMVRANLIAFFAIISAASFAAYFWNGFFTRAAIVETMILTPAYGIALWFGARRFRHATDAAYRRIAYAVIALAAITSLPVLDGILR